MLKTIFFYVVILVVAMLIFSAITDSGFLYKIKSTFSSVKGKLTSGLSSDTCPQINVKMGELNTPYNSSKLWFDSTPKDNIYDGWAIKGKSGCRKGIKEGENLNYYYCGGYSCVGGVCNVNLYVEKTTISDDGEIGKTYKYTIWNIYDENKTFVETRCLGNPDEFDKRQAELIEKDFLKWV